MSTSNTSPTRCSPPRASPNSQACAACKHQRRKCAPGCLLAPFFPATDAKLFLDAHRLFGVKRITNALHSIPDPTQRALAARSIIAQANARAADPVGGCFGVICQLQRQIELCWAELGLVHNRLALCRAQEAVLYNNSGSGNNNDISDLGCYGDVAGVAGEFDDLDRSVFVEEKLDVKKDVLEQVAKDEEKLKSSIFSHH